MILHNLLINIKEFKALHCKANIVLSHQLLTLAGE